MKEDLLKTAMEAAFADMGITEKEFQSLESSVKTTVEVQSADVIVRKEVERTLKVYK